jgi:hypothetical protein
MKLQLNAEEALALFSHLNESYPSNQTPSPDDSVLRSIRNKLKGSLLSAIGGPEQSKVEATDKSKKNHNQLWELFKETQDRKINELSQQIEEAKADPDFIVPELEDDFEPMKKYPARGYRGRPPPPPTYLHTKKFSGSFKG